MDPKPDLTPSRRDLLTKATVAAACAGCAFAAVPVVAYVIPKRAKKPEGSIPVANVKDVPEGSAIKKEVGSMLVLILRHKGKLIAMDAACTHLGCPVEWDELSANVRCNCHGGRFTPEGKRISGPPPKDQEPVDVRVKGDRIFLEF